MRAATIPPTPPTSEHHDRAQDLATVHLGEGRLDVPEADPFTDEPLQRQAPLLVEVDQHREIPARQAVAVPGGLERAAPAEHVEQRSSRRMSGVGTPTSTTVPARSRP